MMKRVIVITAAICLAFIVNAAMAYTWHLVASYPTPVSNPRGFRVSGGSVGYVVEGGSIPYVYQYHLSTGSIVSSFPAPSGGGAWGMTGRTSLKMYISNNRTSWIYEITSTGSVTSSFRCPVAGPADMNLNWISGYLDIAIPDRNIIAVVDETTGSLVRTFVAPGSRPTACCGYQTTLIADSATHTIYENGVPVITNLETPVGADERVSTDNDYYVGLFVVDDFTDHIYMYVKTVAIAPASLGRVKALFE